MAYKYNGIWRIEEKYPEISQSWEDGDEYGYYKREIIRMVWTGTMRLSNRYLQGAI